MNCPVFMPLPILHKGGWEKASLASTCKVHPMEGLVFGPSCPTDSTRTRAPKPAPSNPPLHPDLTSTPSLSPLAAPTFPHI